MLFCVGCQWHLRSGDNENGSVKISIERYDQLERHFLTSGDVAALRQMKTEYPFQTRTLIEDVLRIGYVDEPDINVRFVTFFQDSTLQILMGDVQKQYADMSDVETQLSEAFERLTEMIPTLQTPRVYTQIGSLDQSIVVGDGMLGISLDKYLGAAYPIYMRFGYTRKQREMMTREFIVPDCLSFYLLSLYPFADEAYADMHMARIQHVVNKVTSRNIFTSENVIAVEDYVRSNPGISIDELLTE